LGPRFIEKSQNDGTLLFCIFLCVLAERLAKALGENLLRIVILKAKDTCI
jgi:hypothetical protein